MKKSNSKISGINITNYPSQELEDLERKYHKYREIIKKNSDFLDSAVTLLPNRLDDTYFSHGLRTAYSHSSYFSSIINCLFTSKKQIKNLCNLFNKSNEILFKPIPDENWDLTDELGLFYRLMNVIDSIHKNDKKQLETKMNHLYATCNDMCNRKNQSDKEVDPFEFLQFILEYIDKSFAVINFIISPSLDNCSRLTTFGKCLRSFLKYYEIKLQECTICNVNRNHQIDTHNTVSFIELEKEIALTKYLFDKGQPDKTAYYDTMAIAIADYFECRTNYGEYTCVSCNALSSSTSKVNISNIPKMVVIKRNIFDKGKKKDQIPKLKINLVLNLSVFMTPEAKVNYDNYRNGGNFSYTLKAICFHEGETVHDSYYTTLVRTPKDIWYRHDIAKSAKIYDIQKYLYDYMYEQDPKAEFSTINPYLLFYSLEDITYENDLLIEYSKFMDTLKLVPDVYKDSKKNHEFTTQTVLQQIQEQKKKSKSSIVITKKTDAKKRPEHSNYNLHAEQHESKSSRLDEDNGEESQPSTSKLKRDKHSDYEMNEKERKTKSTKFETIIEMNNDMDYVPFSEGYNNPGTHCFIHVIIHSLTSMRPILHYCTFFDRTYDKIIRSGNICEIFESFMQLIDINVKNKNLEYKDNAVRDFKRGFEKRTKFNDNIRMQISIQQDAHEAFERFIVFINNWMNFILAASPNPYNMEDENKLREFFKVTANEKYHCDHCNQVYERQDKEGFGNGLQLDFTGHTTLQQSINSILDTQVDEYRCQMPGCNHLNKNARKETQFLSLPSILVLQFKLFSYDENGNVNILFINKQISFFLIFKTLIITNK